MDRRAAAFVAGVPVVLLILFVLLAPAAPAGAAVSARGERFVDGAGRQVILRGGALIDKFGDGIPAVGERDWAQMRELGWNSIRLGTAWEFVEPARGEYDESYLARLAAVARDARAHGLLVVVDFHQDVWGRPAGNGAPGWATYPECAGLHVDLASAAGTFAANYFSPFTICQFTRFWADPPLQDAYAAALAQVAVRLGAHVIGYDVMNEPFQGAVAPGAFEAVALPAFYARVAEAVRAVDRDAVMFLEPANAKNVHLPTLTFAGPAPANSAFAPHVYGLWDASDAFSERAPLVAANMAWSRAEGRALRTPVWYGEFGMRRTAPGAEDTLRQIYDEADAQLAGAAVWEYARNEYGVLRADGSLEPARAITVSRPYPARTAGRLRGFRFSDGVFEMRWRSSGLGRRTVVEVPALAFPHGFGVESTARVVRAGGRLLLRAPAGEHSLRLSP